MSSAISDLVRLEVPSVRPACFAMYGQIPDDPDKA
jgi:hypothetical protein